MNHASSKTCPLTQICLHLKNIPKLLETLTSSWLLLVHPQLLSDVAKTIKVKSNYYGSVRMILSLLTSKIRGSNGDVDPMERRKEE